MQTKEKRMVVETSIDRYVVMRNGSRVSDEEYSSKDAAMSEYDHWNRIISRWPDGSKLEIVNLTRKLK